MVYKNFLLRFLFSVIILSVYFILSYINFNLVFYLILLIYFIILLEILLYFKTYKFIPIIYITLSLIFFFNINFNELDILNFNLRPVACATIPSVRNLKSHQIILFSIGQLIFLMYHKTYS